MNSCTNIIVTYNINSGRVLQELINIMQKLIKLIMTRRIMYHQLLIDSLKKKSKNFECSFFHIYWMT